MPAVYTASDTLHDVSALELPENADLLTRENLIEDADPVKGPIGKLIDCVHSLSLHMAPDALTELQGENLTFTGTVTVGTAKHWNVSSRSETRILPVTWRAISGGSFAPQTDGSWKDAATGSALVGEIRFPHAVTLNEVHVPINPKNGHAGLPATLPTAILSSQVVTGSVQTTIATLTDGSANAGAFDAVHNISATGLSVAIDAETKGYTIYFTGEFGGNAEVDLVVYPWVKVIYTRTIAGED